MEGRQFPNCYFPLIKLNFLKVLDLVCKINIILRIKADDRTLFIFIIFLQAKMWVVSPCFFVHFCDIFKTTFSTYVPIH